MLKDSSRRTRFAAVNNDAKAFKQTVCQYIREHIDLDEVSLIHRQMLAERFDITLQCVNHYIKEIQEQRAIFIQLAQKYPIPIKLLSNEAQSIGVSYSTIRKYGIDTNQYKSTGLVTAVYNVRLDFKTYDRNNNTITLYLQDIERGGKYCLRLFPNRNGKYQSYDGGIDFGQGFLNGKLFAMKLGMNAKGYPALYHVSML